jgi:acyl-CoA synthetase (AMP-forming)/AMP-acid ligase II
MDLGSAFAAAVMRQPRQEAFVEGNRRTTYADWYRDIASVAGGLQDMGLRAGDHLVVAVAELAPEELDSVCLRSGLARFKRPREYVFVKAIPRSASAKLLRRKLRTGEYEAFEGNKVTVKEDS